jgi:hypothetical protein
MGDATAHLSRDDALRVARVRRLTLLVKLVNAPHCVARAIRRWVGVMDIFRAFSTYQSWTSGTTPLTSATN